MRSGPRGEKAGDRSRIRPVTGWQWLWRAQPGITIDGVTWDVDLDLFDTEDKVNLYRDGALDRVQRGRSSFEVPPAHRIGVRWSMNGLSRAHLVDTARHEVPLEPRPGTGERWRADLKRERPDLSRLLAATSWTLVVAALILQVPQVLELVAAVTEWFDLTSPVSLPGPVNAFLTIGGVLAAVERALRMRHHWLLDD
ncbi:MAG: hypothetical protein ACTMKU_00940 [Actinomycetaceae bacterium]